MIHGKTWPRIHKCARNVRAELDRDTQGYDKIDEADSVQAYAPQPHHAHDVDYGQRHHGRYDHASSPGPKKQRCHNQDRCQSKPQNLLSDRYNMGILVEKYEEQRVRENRDAGPPRHVIRYPVGGVKRIDIVGLGLQWVKESPEVGCYNVVLRVVN